MLSKSKEEFSQFLPLENSINFLPPEVKAFSYRSDLFHEKMIKNIAKITLNKIAHNYKTQEEKNEDVKKNEKQSIKKITNDNHKKKEHTNESKRENKLKASDLDLDNKEELVKKLEKRSNRI